MFCCELIARATCINWSVQLGVRSFCCRCIIGYLRQLRVKGSQKQGNIQQNQIYHLHAQPSSTCCSTGRLVISVTIYLSDEGTSFSLLFRWSRTKNRHSYTAHSIYTFRSKGKRRAIHTLAAKSRRTSQAIHYHMVEPP